MHPNPAYRKPGAAWNLAFARNRGFGALTIAGEPFPLASHLPFALAADGTRAEAHIVRSNPIAQALADGPAPALLAVSGPDGYVSPNWYDMADQVPTWNYVAVHLRGSLSLAPPESLRAHLERLSARFEADLAPKPPWTLAKMDPVALARMERMIVPVTLAIAQVDGTWKLGQNKPDAARLGAAGRIDGSVGADLAALAAMMAEPPG